MEAPRQAPLVAAAAQASLLPPFLTAQVPFERPSQASTVVVPVQRALVDAVPSAAFLPAQVPVEAAVQLAWEMSPVVASQAFTQLVLVPSALTAHVAFCCVNAAVVLL